MGILALFACGVVLMAIGGVILTLTVRFCDTAKNDIFMAMGWFVGFGIGVIPLVAGFGFLVWSFVNICMALGAK